MMSRGLHRRQTILCQGSLNTNKQLPMLEEPHLGRAIALQESLRRPCRLSALREQQKMIQQAIGKASVALEVWWREEKE
jgi:hypothetical protein